ARRSIAPAHGCRTPRGVPQRSAACPTSRRPRRTQGTRGEMTTTPATTSRAHLEAFFSRVNPHHGRVIFCVDATASRQEGWDTASHLQAQMFDTIATVGTLEVQLVYYRGYGECVASGWKSDAQSLAAVMTAVTCASGHTQIGKVLKHAAREHGRESI